MSAFIGARDCPSQGDGLSKDSLPDAGTEERLGAGGGLAIAN